MVRAALLATTLVFSATEAGAFFDLVPTRGRVAAISSVRAIAAIEGDATRWTFETVIESTAPQVALVFASQGRDAPERARAFDRLDALTAPRVEVAPVAPDCSEPTARSQTLTTHLEMPTRTTAQVEILQRGASLLAWLAKHGFDSKGRAEDDSGVTIAVVKLGRGTRRHRVGPFSVDGDRALALDRFVDRAVAGRLVAVDLWTLADARAELQGFEISMLPGDIELPELILDELSVTWDAVRDHRLRAIRQPTALLEYSGRAGRCDRCETMAQDDLRALGWTGDSVHLARYHLRPSRSRTTTSVALRETRDGRSKVTTWRVTRTDGKSTCAPSRVQVAKVAKIRQTAVRTLAALTGQSIRALSLRMEDAGLSITGATSTPTGQTTIQR